MADWIRMRSSLIANPRVTKMARVLLSEREFLDWLCPGCDVPVTRDEAVTKRHIQVVTRVIVGGLLSTWSMVNETAARDGVVRHAASRDIDETAGIPCFGKALLAVEWLEELPGSDGVQFVNFEEHNSPQKERTLTAKTGAERSRAYRERKASEAATSQDRDVMRDVAGDVMRDVTRNGLIEESREEKKNPSGSSAPSKSTRKPRGVKRVPDGFAVSPEMQAWAEKDAPLVDWRRETDKFRDWEFKHPRSDWPATWRTWMRKAHEDAAMRASGGSRAGNSGDWTAGAH